MGEGGEGWSTNEGRGEGRERGDAGGEGRKGILNSGRSCSENLGRNK